MELAAVYGANGFPTNDNTTINLFQLPDSKTVTNWKIIVLKFWVERESKTYVDASSGGFNSIWSGFVFLLITITYALNSQVIKRAAGRVSISFILHRFKILDRDILL